MEVNLKKSGNSQESPRNSLKAVEFLMNQMKQYAKRKSLIKFTFSDHISSDFPQTTACILLENSKSSSLGRKVIQYDSY